MSYYIASVLQCEYSNGNKKVFPFAISTTLSLYVASVVQRLAFISEPEGIFPSNIRLAALAQAFPGPMVATARTRSPLT